MTATRRGALLLLLGASGLQVATAEAPALLSEVQASIQAGDDVCEAGDDECALSLRQLRTAVVDGHVADILKPPAAAAGDKQAKTPKGAAGDNQAKAPKAEAGDEQAKASKGTKARKHHGEDESALERRAAMSGTADHASNLLQTLTGKTMTMLYHQTSPEIAGLILQGGFKPGSAGWCGGAIYFADSARATFTKAIGTQSHTGVILQASVSLGRICQMGRTCDRSMTGEMLQAKGCDSIRFNPGDGNEYVVYDPRQVTSVKVAWMDQASMAKMGYTGEMAMSAELGAEMDEEMQKASAAMGSMGDMAIDDELGAYVEEEMQ